MSIEQIQKLFEEVNDEMVCRLLRKKIIVIKIQTSIDMLHDIVSDDSINSLKKDLENAQNDVKLILNRCLFFYDDIKFIKMVDRDQDDKNFYNDMVKLFDDKII